ncbi:hypothetical protein AVEN_144129-1 [Araneus ventricosus]|uniref:Uncharacterized protein n=1 Tax=Araneus ventricosus TaxID=182803 RepID=A0A4Y2TQ81_ARAVE|nr:hypothetical protein AVEN_144129-1 [Araneus ventricosus]
MNESVEIWNPQQPLRQGMPNLHIIDTITLTPSLPSARQLVVGCHVQDTDCELSGRNNAIASERLPEPEIAICLGSESFNFYFLLALRFP